MRAISRWLHETAGGLPRQFWYLWGTTLINRVGSFVIIVLAIYLTGERGLSEAFAGLVIGLWGAGGAVGTTVGGVLADRWGRKPTLLASLWSGAALMVVLGFMRDPIGIAVAALLLGAVGEAVRPATSAMMVDIVPTHDRARAFSLHYWVINLGFAFAAAAAGFVAGVDPTLLFLIDAATMAVAGLWAALVIREPVRPRLAADPTGSKDSTVDEGLLAVLRDRVFLVFFGANLLTAFVFLQHISTLPLSMTRDGLAPSAYGSVIALNGLFIVVGQFFLTWVMRRLDHTVALAIAGVVLGIGFGLTAFATTPLFYAITVLIWTVGEMFQAPSNATTVASLSPAHLRGRYQGVFGLSWSVASFFAPVLGGAVLQYGGKVVLWLGCLGLSLIAAAIHLLARPSRDRRAAQLAAATESTPPLVAAATHS